MFPPNLDQQGSNVAVVGLAKSRLASEPHSDGAENAIGGGVAGVNWDCCYRAAKHIPM
jgi:deoxyinosine 3'endonuclease (endonuclease V)